MSFYDDASLVFLPSGGAGKDTKAYSIKPTNGDGDFTFSRGSNLTTTRIDSNGLIEKGRENLLLQSNSFDTTWIESNASATNGQSGYDGSTDAWLLSKSAASGRIYQNVSVSGVATYSIYAKAGTTDWLYIIGSAGIYPEAYFDLSNGVVGNSSSNPNFIGANIQDVGNGWYRCSITFNSSISRVWIYPADSDGVTSGTSGSIYIQDAQLEIGLTSTEYIESGASTGLAGILEDSPRFDYSGGASCPSLLLEPSRTNIVGFTEYIEGTNWGVGGSTGLQLRTSITSPDGNNGVYLVTSEAENTSSRVQYNLGTLGNDHIFSVFIKGTGSATRIRLRNNTASVNAVEYNIDSSGNFTLHSQSALDGYYGADDYGNGWHRVYLKVDTDGGSDNFMQIYSDVVDADGSMYVWGVQAEDASYITSYIPNHSGGSVTREADVCGGAGTSSTFNDSEGVLYAEISALADDGTYRILSINDGTKNERVYMQYTSTTNQISVVVKNGNSTQANIPFILSDETQYAKVAVRYKANDFALYINGTQRGTDTSGTTPVGLDNFSFDQGNGTTNFYGNVKQVLVFNTALSDPEMIALTS